MKMATTPINPKINPIPLARGRAPAESMFSGDIKTTTNYEVYMSVYF
jgi:hypothetical protein